MLYFVYIAGASTVAGELYLKFQSRTHEIWRYLWLVDASWEAIFTLFLCAVMSLMRPSESSKLLAYIEELGEEPPVSAAGTQNNTLEVNKPEEIEL
jgi:Lung seven transmembrane receptor